jgi:hypothetical protein
VLLPRAGLAAAQVALDLIDQFLRTVWLLEKRAGGQMLTGMFVSLSKQIQIRRTAYPDQRYCQ